MYKKRAIENKIKYLSEQFSVLSDLPDEAGEGAVVCMLPMVIPHDNMNKIVPLKAI